MPEVKYYDFPDMWTRADPEVEMARLKDAQDAGLIGPRLDVSCIANTTEWKRLTGMTWTVPAINPKQWRTAGPIEMVFFEREPDGTPAATVPYGDSISSWWSDDFARFYKEYGPSHFPNLPKLKKVSFTAEEADTFTLGPGSGMDYPLCRMNLSGRPNFPKNIGIVVRDGRLQWFFISEYKAAYPITVTATIPNPVSMPDWMIRAQAKAIVNATTMPDPAAVAALRSLMSGTAGVQSQPWQNVPQSPSI